MRILVVSDTHAPRRWKTMPPRLADTLASVDLILHAGDVCTPAVLDSLAEFAPVRVVLGNNDGPDIAEWGAPPTLEFEAEGVAIAMIHDSGRADGRAARMRRRFPTADLVVFGHSHVPLNTAEAGLRLFNPGSPTDPRSQPTGTFGILQIDDGVITCAGLHQV